MGLQWEKHKIKKNLSGELSVCKHCSRKFVICCICGAAKKRWDDMLTEIQTVSERDRSGEP